MTKKNTDWKSELHQVVEVLRNPFKMRVIVVGVTLAVMCFAINDPLQGKMQQADRELGRMKATVRSAEEVMLLRSHFETVEDRIIKGKSSDVVVSHLIDLVRQEPVELMRIDAQAAERLGPMYSIRVAIDVHGSFDALTRLLHRFDFDRYLIRVETVSIEPPKRDGLDPSMSVSLQMIKDAA